LQRITAFVVYFVDKFGSEVHCVLYFLDKAGSEVHCVLYFLDKVGSEVHDGLASTMQDRGEVRWCMQLCLLTSSWLIKALEVDWM